MSRFGIGVGFLYGDTHEHSNPVRPLPATGASGSKAEGVAPDPGQASALSRPAGGNGQGKA